MKESLLSVIVPIYNVKDYLKECLDSIISQTYKNIEIILVDDGSYNGEAEICDRYAAIDNRIKVIHKQNEGLVAARKSGLEATTAEYVAFVDGDDYIEPDYYERMMAKLSSSDADLVATGIQKIYPNGKLEILNQPIEDGEYYGDSLDWLLENMNSLNDEFYNPAIFPSTCTKIYKKNLLSEILETVPNDITMGEDAAITYPYLLRCKKIVADNSACGYIYRVSDGTMTRSFDINYFNRISKLYTHLKSYYDKENNDNIDRQLDIYRSYLIYLGINNIMSAARDVDKLECSRSIITGARDWSAFDNSEKMIKLNVPRSLKIYLKLMKNKCWRIFGIIWILREEQSAS